jgi:hypothetical protein
MVNDDPSGQWPGDRRKPHTIDCGDSLGCREPARGHRSAAAAGRVAAAGHGIVFRRIDLGREIEARFGNVTDTYLCTTLADPAMQWPASARSST